MGNFDGTCKCKLGMTGTNCATSYCDDVLFPCMNGGECVCNAEPYDCFSECVAEAGCEDACRAKCPAGSATQYTVSECPAFLGARQTTCSCPCGYSGAYCQTATECTASS